MDNTPPEVYPDVEIEATRERLDDSIGRILNQMDNSQSVIKLPFPLIKEGEKFDLQRYDLISRYLRQKIDTKQIMIAVNKSSLENTHETFYIEGDDGKKFAALIFSSDWWTRAVHGQEDYIAQSLIDLYQMIHSDPNKTNLHPHNMKENKLVHIVDYPPELIDAAWDQ